MEGKLIKLEESKYTLVYKEGNIAWENNPAFDGKLSLKNCQAIENGYDLDELVKEQYPIDEPSFKRGFKLALEILGDKKFSEFLDKEKELGISDKKTIERIQWYYNTYFDKSQKNEWDVVIVMDICGDKVYAVPEHALDEDGCLILKRK